MRRQRLQVLSLDGDETGTGTPFLEAVPVLAEHVVCDAVHGDVVVAAELIDGVMDGKVGVVAERPAHIGPECLLESACDMVGHRPLPLLIEVVPEECVDLHVPSGVDIVTPGAARPVQGDADVVLPLVRRHRAVCLRHEVEMQFDQPPEQGAPFRLYEVAAVIDAQHIFTDGSADLHIHRHDVVLFSHDANIVITMSGYGTSPTMLI